MLRAEGGPVNLQGVSVERLCLGILARGLKHTSEVVEADGIARMLPHRGWSG